MTHTLTIPRYRPPTLNQLFRVGLRRRMRLEHECREFVGVYRHVQGIPPAIGKRRVSVTVTLTGKQRIPDEDADGWKALLDALVSARLLVDDSRKWCKKGEWLYERGDANETVITLEDC